MAKHVSPSKIRYQERNPMISVRLTKPLRELLDLARGDKGYSKFIQALLSKKLLELDQVILKNSYNKGYAKARLHYEITYPCATCGQPVTISPGGEDHEDVKKYLKDEGWVHGECIEQ